MEEESRMRTEREWRGLRVGRDGRSIFLRKGCRKVGEEGLRLEGGGSLFFWRIGGRILGWRGGFCNDGGEEGGFVERRD